VTDAAAAQTIEQIFLKWPDLPDRILPATNGESKPHASTPSFFPVVDDSVVAKNVAYGKGLRYQIWHSDGRLIFRSANAPVEPITQKLGFSDSPDVQGKDWRHYSIWDRAHTLRVVVSESTDMREQLLRGIAFSAISPVALGMPVLIILIWLSIKRGLRPLTQLSREIVSRKPDSLAYLDETTTPWELLPIVMALNDLLKRVTTMLEAERRFNDNAAHELRTPLAAIQAHLYAARQANNESERQLSLDQAQQGVGRGIRLVSQMLTLARLEPDQIMPNFVRLDLAEMVQNVCAELTPLALARDQTLELLADDDLPPLTGISDMLAMLLSNLLDNAIRYTRQGGHISVTVRLDGQSLVMTVTDDGPGIPPAQRERVFQRFYRLADQNVPGTGLGLAICRSIADLHHAHISLSDAPTGTGLSVHVTFPILD
jgi:two-component system sensor histidine kinase QseC